MDETQRSARDHGSAVLLSQVEEKTRVPDRDYRVAGVAGASPTAVKTDELDENEACRADRSGRLPRVLPFVHFASQPATPG